MNQLETFSEEDFPVDETEFNISTKACRKGLVRTCGSSSAMQPAWARMLAKIYEINPYICPRLHGNQ